jgi:hypothetical protein
MATAALAAFKPVLVLGLLRSRTTISPFVASFVQLLIVETHRERH